MDESKTAEFRPPYLSFATFWSFLDAMLAQPLPPKIDRSMMRSKSGSDQVSLTAALKAFSLIDDSQAVTGLRALEGCDQAARTQWLDAVIRKFYPAQIAVSAENGTEQQLRESFRDDFQMTSSETIRKSMTFFLHAARTAGIELSPHFPTSRTGSGSPGSPKPRRPAAKRKPPADPAKPADSQNVLRVDGDTYTLTMDSGPVVTLTVKLNVMEASVDDRNFVFRLVDALRGYGKPPQAPGSNIEVVGNGNESSKGSL